MKRSMSKDNKVYKKRYGINNVVWDDSALNYYAKKFIHAYNLYLENPNDSSYESYLNIAHNEVKNLLNE